MDHDFETTLGRFFFCHKLNNIGYQTYYYFQIYGGMIFFESEYKGDYENEKLQLGDCWTWTYC